MQEDIGGKAFGTIRKLTLKGVVSEPSRWQKRAMAKKEALENSAEPAIIKK